MQFDVSWAITARSDFEEIAAYIAEDSAINALKIIERVEARAQTLETFPSRGRIVPELNWHGVAKYLEVFERPWRIVYRIDENSVYIVSVLDGRRKLEDLLLFRFLRQ